MRLWSLHPKYLDVRGLVALWREALLAQAVLRGQTTGYRHHPQLLRFEQAKPSVGAIAEYLRPVYRESVQRGYAFASDKIHASRHSGFIYVTRGQIEYEWQHLLRKLETRDPQWKAQLKHVKRPVAHPLFQIVQGEVESWERIVDL
jgi:hypothetical protein